MSTNGNGHNGNGKKRGRPVGTSIIEMDPEFRERLLASLAQYESKSAACAEVGITYRTLKNWLEKAWNATEGFWHHFFIAYTRARAPFWEAATQALSRRDPSILLANECPDEWTRKSEVEVTIKGDPFDLLADPEVSLALDRSFSRRAPSSPMAPPGSSRN